MKIKEAAYREVIAHAQAEIPIEACGYLGGKDGVVTESIRLTNVDHSPEHFSLDPAEQFAATRKLRKAGLEFLAVYHSHPASPARPSQEDIRLAFDPRISYVIVSLATITPDVRAFSIRNGIAAPEPIELVQYAEEHLHVL